MAQSVPTPAATYAAPPVATVLSTAAPASLLVRLPAAASLRIDDTPTDSATDRRLFHTPPLVIGKEYEYTLTAKLNVEGDLKTLVRKVKVRGGEQTLVTFDFEALSASSK